VREVKKVKKVKKEGGRVKKERRLGRCESKEGRRFESEKA
jgi:hypothetical protein